MTRAAVGIVFVVAVVLSAQASSPAPCIMSTTNSEERAVVQAVCDGLAAKESVAELRKREQEARRDALLGSPDSDAHFDLLLEWDAAAADLREAENAMTSGFGDAIRKSLELYGVVPDNPDGEIIGGPAKGRRAVWGPRYKGRADSADDVVEEVVLSDGRRIHPRLETNRDKKKRPGGITWPDGRVAILDETFERVRNSGSPRMLGFVLYHESVHFDQLRDGTWASLYLREVAAYRKSMAMASRFGLTREELVEVRGFLLANIAKAAKQGLGPGRGSDIPTPADEAINSDYWSRLEEGRKKFNEEQVALEQNLKKEREAREVRQAVSDRQEEDIRRAELSEFAEGTLKSWLRAECAGVGRPSWLNPADVERAYGNLLVPMLPVNLWEILPYYSGVPCTDFLMNMVLLDRFAGRPLRSWDDWAGLARLAKERSRASSPVQAAPQPAPSPTPAVPDSDPGPSFPMPPAIPHCRYHPWCQDTTQGRP